MSEGSRSLGLRALLWRGGDLEPLRVVSCADAHVRDAVFEHTGRLGTAVELYDPRCRLPRETCRSPVGAILRTAP